MNKEYKSAMRDFISNKGSPVQGAVDTYGWVDYRALDHGRTCWWVVEPGAVVSEHTYSLFQDTFSDNLDEVGINCSPVDCACGEYVGITLRYTGSLAEVIQFITGQGNTQITL